MRHARDYGPENYEMDYRKYYKLNPYVTGSSNELCANSQRTYSSDTEISGSDYYWTRNESLLDYVSGQGTTDYRVKGKSGVKGNAWVQLQITTPSDEVATNKKYFWVGVPIITNKKVDGGYYYPGMQICPGDHYLNVTPVGGDAGTATWTVPPGIVYFVGINELDFTFPFSASSVAITARSANTCGTGSNASFYLTKKYYGCGRSYGMTLYPNPADSYLEITLDESKLADYSGTEMSLQSFDIGINAFFRIIDKYGEVKLTQKYSGEKVTQINTSKLPPGLYAVQLVTNDKVFSTNIMVSR